MSQGKINTALAPPELVGYALPGILEMPVVTLPDPDDSQLTRAQRAAVILPTVCTYDMRDLPEGGSLETTARQATGIIVGQRWLSPYDRQIHQVPSQERPADGPGGSPGVFWSSPHPHYYRAPRNERALHRVLTTTTARVTDYVDEKAWRRDLDGVASLAVEVEAFAAMEVEKKAYEQVGRLRPTVQQSERDRVWDLMIQRHAIPRRVVLGRVVAAAAEMGNIVDVSRRLPLSEISDGMWPGRRVGYASLVVCAMRQRAAESVRALDVVNELTSSAVPVG